MGDGGKDIERAQNKKCEGKPDTPPASSMMNVSLAVAAPVRFSIRLKVIALNPVVVTVPELSPLRSQTVSKSRSTTIESSRLASEPTNAVMSS